VKVDAHVHTNFRGFGTGEVIAYLDRLGIDRCWLLSWVDEQPCDESYSRMSVEDVLKTTAAHPGRFVPFASVDPRRPDRLSLLRQWLEKGCRGLGEQKHQVAIDDPRQMELFQAAGEAGVPVLFHMDVPLPGQSFWYNTDCGRLAAALAACSSTTFVGHGPGFWRAVCDESLNPPEPYPKGPITREGPVPDLLKRFPNLYADISAGSGVNALTRDPKWTRGFVDRFWDRILYGTDTFTEEQIALVASWNLPPDRHSAVMGGNALQLIPAPK